MVGRRSVVVVVVGGGLSAVGTAGFGLISCGCERRGVVTKAKVKRSEKRRENSGCGNKKTSQMRGQVEGKDVSYNRDKYAVRERRWISRLLGGGGGQKT